MRATTVRFGDDLWALLEQEAAAQGVSTAQFGRLNAMMAEAANECCDGRIVAMTEGGYDLPAIAGSLQATIAAFEGRSTLANLPAPPGATCISSVRRTWARRPMSTRRPGP